MTLRCMIVDDNTEVLTAASELLESEGLAIVAIATNGAEAMRAIEVHRPDLVLIDIDLRGESGFELARTLQPRLEKMRSRSILISTHAECDFRYLIAASPAIRFIGKAQLSASAIEELVASVS